MYRWAFFTANKNIMRESFHLGEGKYSHTPIWIGGRDDKQIGREMHGQTDESRRKQSEYVQLEKV